MSVSGALRDCTGLTHTKLALPGALAPEHREWLFLRQVPSVVKCGGDKQDGSERHCMPAWVRF